MSAAACQQNFVLWLSESPMFSLAVACLRSRVACRYELVLEHEDDIATIMTMESGKPLKESHGEFLSG